MNQTITKAIGKKKKKKLKITDNLKLCYKWKHWTKPEKDLRKENCNFLELDAVKAVAAPNPWKIVAICLFFRYKVSRIGEKSWTEMTRGERIESCEMEIYKRGIAERKWEWAEKLRSEEDTSWVGFGLRSCALSVGRFIWDFSFCIAFSEFVCERKREKHVSRILGGQHSFHRQFFFLSRRRALIVCVWNCLYC